MRSEFVISHTDDIYIFFACMNQLCGLIIYWSDQPYADSKLLCHCEHKASTTDAYIIDHIVYNIYTKEETLIRNISPKVILCYTCKDVM